MNVKFVLIGAVMSTFVCGAFAQDWNSVSYINHSTYQAVSSTGSSTYSSGYPIKFVGVVLNDNFTWLNPTSAYDSGVHLWQMGGQAEIYVQAVNLDDTAYDTDTQTTYNDSNGTACWIGQNYGNHYMRQDPAYNYTESEWYAELDRLGMWYEGSMLDASQLVQAGDLIEIRVRAGMAYNGKNNVNEQHNNDSSKDYEIVILQKGYGLPSASEISLSALKTAGNEFIFDETRQTGGELYQSTLVELLNVQFASVDNWGQNSDFTVTDANGRTLTVHLGLDDMFDTMTAPELGQRYNITGILDQASSSGMDGYKLLVLDSDYLVAVPEPASICVLGAMAVLGLLRKRKR